MFLYSKLYIFECKEASKNQSFTFLNISCSIVEKCSNEKRKEPHRSESRYYMNTDAL